MKNKKYNHGHYHAMKEKCRKEYGWHCRNTHYTIITRNNYLRMHGIPMHKAGSHMLRMVIDNDYIYYFNRDHSVEYKIPNTLNWQRRIEDD